MKKMYTNGSRAFVLGLLLLSGITSFAQTFYSRFPDVKGKFQVADPTGASCQAPRVQNKAGMVDEYDTSYAYFAVPDLAAPLTCSTPTYSFTAALNLPADTPYAGNGFKAGFRIRIPTGISLDMLRKYLQVTTYKDNQPQETAAGATLVGADSLGTGVDWYVYFTAVKAFNGVNLLVDESIIPLHMPFEFDVLYAEATLNSVLPATIANFRLTATGRSVTLSWQSLTETNVLSYSVQRSNNGGTSYLPVATVPATGNGSAAVNYTYNDLLTADGNYWYRIVVLNKDGSSKATYSITANSNGQNKLFIYPSLAKRGQAITVSASQTGVVTLQLFTAQGQLVMQQRKDAGTVFTIATGALGAGVYWVKVISATGSSVTSKVIVE